MGNLPENVTRIDVARVDMAARKMCRCAEPHYVVDVPNRLVHCGVCGALVDPFDAIKYIACHYDRVNRAMERQLEERRQIDEYKPRRVVMKKLEELFTKMGRHDFVPTCPRCGECFDLEELLTVKWKVRTPDKPHIEKG